MLREIRNEKKMKFKNEILIASCHPLHPTECEAARNYLLVVFLTLPFNVKKKFSLITINV